MSSVEDIRKRAEDLKKQYEDLMQNGNLTEQAINDFEESLKLLKALLNVLSLPEDSITNGLSPEMIGEFLNNVVKAIIDPDIAEIANATKHLKD